MDKVPMTAAGLKTLEAELRQLRDVDRPAISKAIGVAREHGDLKENAEYHAAKERQSFIEGRLKELEGVISHAEVIDPASLSGDTVKFGATVMLIDEETDEEVTYKIVGSYESDVSKGLLPVTSPLSKALMGKAVGASVEVHTPKGTKFYEVVNVEFK
ncbi:MAG: transcription elongation factor GreA [Proteobacteria bacterium]|nr:transcription elongation factor GreA [Pseudomonadota bacterium]